MSAGSKRRVQFRAPSGLIEQADALAAVLETDRTDILTSALRQYLQSAAHDETITQEIAGAYYDDDITYEELQELVGHEAAANFRVLKGQLEEEFLDGAAEDLRSP